MYIINYDNQRYRRFRKLPQTQMHLILIMNTNVGNPATSCCVRERPSYHHEVSETGMMFFVLLIYSKISRHVLGVTSIGHNETHHYYSF